MTSRDLWIEQQRATYTKWLNTHLAPHDRVTRLPDDLAANDMAEVEAAGRTLDAVTTAAQRAASAAISIRMDLGLGIHGEAGAHHIPYAGAR